MNDTELSQLDVAKAALGRRDFDAARSALTPLVADAGTGTPAFFFARVEFEEGNLKAAQEHLDRFRATRPKHAGAFVLNARIALAHEDFEQARKDTLSALELNPDLIPAQKLLEQIAASENREVALRHIAVIEDGYLNARTEGPTQGLRDAAEALSKLAPGPNWQSDGTDARIAYFHFAPDLDAALRNYDSHLIDVSTKFDYITWPKRIQEFVKGKTVLDVGCGFGGYGMGFLVAGATDYAGLDPVMNLDSTRAKNKRLRVWDDMGVTPRAIAEALPAIRLFQGTSEDLDFEEKFDTVALHNVTEHLIQLDMVFEGLVPVCREDTRIIFLHHNYYCWNGHHMMPNRPDQLDEKNETHQLHYDWRHIEAMLTVPDDHYFKTRLNRVRLDEIRDITEKHFDVEIWDEIPSSKPTLARLTPEILQRVRKTIPDLTPRDLETNVVYCVARPKKTG